MIVKQILIMILIILSSFMVIIMIIIIRRGGIQAVLGFIRALLPLRWRRIFRPNPHPTTLCNQ